MILSKDKTYVFDGTEVKFTGREAVKETPIRQKIVDGEKKTIFREYKLFEITPIDGFEWKKWVDVDQLFEVKNENN